MTALKKANRPMLLPGDRFLDAAETAEILHTTTATLADFRVKGKGPPFFRHGRAIRYLLSEISEYGLRHRVEPGEKTFA